MKQKKKSITTVVVGKILAVMCITSILLTLDIWFILKNDMREGEGKYMEEVISRVSLEINDVLNGYITVAQSSAKSHSLKEFLIEGQNTTDLGHESYVDVEGFSYYQSAIAELQSVAEMFGESVMYVNVCSIYKDNYLTHQGYRGDADFSLKQLPFYEVVSRKSTYISDPYQDVLSDVMLVAIAEPIFHDDGSVIGIFAIEICTEELAKIAATAPFGESGNMVLLDRSQTILVCPESSYVGQSVSALQCEGDSFYNETVNPTGVLFEYSREGVNRTGGALQVSDLTGWVMVCGIDSSEFSRSTDEVVASLLTAQLIAVLLMTTICWRNIHKGLGAPMKELEEFMEALSEGNLKARVDYKGKDEIGRLAENMNRTAETLSTYVKGIDSAMKEFERGDFTQVSDVKYKGEFQSIEQSMEKFVQMMSTSLWDLSVAIEEVRRGSVKVAEDALFLDSGTSEQSESVVGLTSLIAGLNETIVATARSSSDVTKEARHISKDLMKNNVNMQNLVTSVQGIRTMSDEVKRIIATIEDVAFQTNLLSLNASVEASRAGISGRGFAVVADEVRNLSFETANAAEETTKIINSIADSIENSAMLCQRTSGELQKVVEDVDVFVEKITVISTSAQEQATAIGEINRGVGSISKVVQKNSTVSAQSASASEELSGQSGVMLSLVEQFKVKESTPSSVKSL